MGKSKFRPAVVILSMPLIAGILSYGCSGGGSSPPAATGGMNGSGGAPGSGGDNASGGAISTGGGGAGGSVMGSGGAVSDGAVVDVTGTDVIDGPGQIDASGEGIGRNCAGNAISLSSNGTGTASDAAQARVIIDLMTDLPIGNANRTVEFWAFIKPTDWVGESNQLYFYGATGANTTFGMDFGTFAVSGMANNHATLDPFAAFSDDSTNYLSIDSTSAQWVQIAMIWDGTAVKTYVNGALRITSMRAGAPAALATGRSTLSLGCNPTNKLCFNGMFDELRIWNVARSAAEIMATFDKPLVGNEPGLIGYWKFDEAPGSPTAADSVTTGGHMAHPGTPMATSTNERPTFVIPMSSPPLVCP